MFLLHQCFFVSYGAVLYTVNVEVIAYVGVAVKSYKIVKLLHKIFPELKDILDFIYENKGIVYSKKLVKYIIKSSLDEVSSNIKENI